MDDLHVTEDMRENLEVSLVISSCQRSIDVENDGSLLLTTAEGGKEN